MILAGGASRRFGADKALADLGGRTLVALVAAALAPFTTDLMISIERSDRPLPEDLPARPVTDLHPGQGPLAGFYAGLLAAQHERCLVAACDMPFIQPEVLSLLAACEEDAVVPFVDGARQPLLAMYTKACLPQIGAMLREGDLRAENLCFRAAVRYVEEDELRSVDPDLKSFLNVNRPEDLTGHF